MARDSSESLWVLVLASAANLMVGLDALVVSAALNEIGRDLHAPIEALEWTVNAYALGFAAFLLPAIVFGDRLGRRNVFSAGLLLFVVASAGCALAPSIESLILARAVQGIGSAIVMPLALTQVSAAFAPERRGWALGIYASTAGLSTVMGPVVGGLVTQGLTWHWIFWLNLPIGTFTAALAMTRLRQTFGPRDTIDLLGLVLCSAASLALVWGLVRVSSTGWRNVGSLLSLSSGVLIVFVFIAWELRTPKPMIPMGFFRLRSFAAGNAAMFLLNGALMSSIFFMPQFQQVVLGANPLTAGIGLLPWGVAVMGGARSANVVAQRIGRHRAVTFGLAIQAVGLGWISYIATPATSEARLIFPMLLAGFGFALAVTNLQSIVVQAVLLPDIGKAAGTLSTIRQLGGAFGVALAVSAFSGVGNRATPIAFSHGFAAAIGVSATLSLVGAAIGLLLPRARAKKP